MTQCAIHRPRHRPRHRPPHRPPHRSPLLFIALVSVIGLGCSSDATDVQGTATGAGADVVGAPVGDTGLEVRFRLDAERTVPSASDEATSADDGEPASAPGSTEDGGAAAGGPESDTEPPSMCTPSTAGGCAEYVVSDDAPTRYPIVMVHGMGGFEDLLGWDYFHRVPERLRGLGYDVFVPINEPFHGSDFRADRLARYLDVLFGCTCVEKVNLIAHSQGGIDSRYLIGALSYGDRVASLTTVSTPHRGSPLADAFGGVIPDGAQPLADDFTSFIASIYAEPTEESDLDAALLWTSPAFLEQFNEDHPNDPRVAYFSWAGFSGLLADGGEECAAGEVPPPKRGDIAEPVFSATFLWLRALGLHNDGLVPVPSAVWGRFRGCVPADHMDQIGQFGGVTDRLDHRQFYADIAAFLASEGH